MIWVVNEKDKEGEFFYFEVNGILMFVKGVNYIFDDVLFFCIIIECYRILFWDMKEVNMNMVCIWGGGIYEDDCFYDLVDENGIFVWQDFMFVCIVYFSDFIFLKWVEEEVEYNIKCLCNYVLLVMWCGNNEILEGLKYWGWQKNYILEVYENMFWGYDKLFWGLFFVKVQEFDEGCFYKYFFFYFVNWGCLELWGIGDSYNWGVWYGKKIFELLDMDLL